MTIYVVQVILRMRADEAEGTLEPLLASGVTRSRWVGAYVVNAVGGSVVLILGYSVSMGLGVGLVLGETSANIRQTVTAGLVQLPAVFLVGAGALAAVALLPRLAPPLAWGVVIVSLLLGPTFGPPLGVPERILDFSPFTHVPPVPATDATAPPLLILGGICLTLTAIATAAIRSRSRHSPRDDAAPPHNAVSEAPGGDPGVLVASPVVADPRLHASSRARSRLPRMR